MTIFRMIFSGQIKKAEHRTAGGKSLVEVSICKKTSRPNEPDAFTWLKVSIWEPADFQAAKLVKGAHISGSGEFKMRSYEKDGAKGVSAEASCRSFDVEVVSEGGTEPAHTEARPAPSRPAAPAAGPGDDEPPF